MNDAAASSPLARPVPLKSRRGALIVLLTTYVAWVAFLAWLYFSEVASR
jgi:hypothetical protein